MSEIQPKAAETSDEALEHLGYHSEFSRVIKPFASFALSVSQASITTGVFLGIGTTFAIAGGAGLWVFALNGLMMLFVGLVYATIAARIPVAGIEYQWGSRLVHPTVGTAFGWLAFATQAIGAVAVDYVLCSSVLPALFSYESSTGLTMAITAVVLVVQGAILARSTKLTTMINSFVVIGELVVVVGLAILLLLVGAIRGEIDFHNLFSTAPISSHGYFAVLGHAPGPFWILISVAFFSIADGFQGAAGVVEETKDASRVVPRSMVRTLAVTLVVQVFLMIALVSVSHNLTALGESSTATADVISSVLGEIVSRLFLVVVAFNVFSCGMVIFLQTSRFSWAMSRDRRFPGWQILRRVDPRTKTPVAATVLVGIVMLAILAFFGNSEDAFENLIAASGLMGIVGYLLMVAAFAFFGNRVPVSADFDLGRWTPVVVVLAMAWLIFCLLIFRSGFSEAWRYFGVIVGVGIVLFGIVALTNSRSDPGEEVEARDGP